MSDPVSSAIIKCAKAIGDLATPSERSAVLEGLIRIYLPSSLDGGVGPRSSSADRARAYRKRKRDDERDASRDASRDAVTDTRDDERDASRDAVTGRHALGGRGVSSLSGSDPSPSEQSPLDTDQGNGSRATPLPSSTLRREDAVERFCAGLCGAGCKGYPRPWGRAAEAVVRGLEAYREGGGALGSEELGRMYALYTGKRPGNGFQFSDWLGKGAPSREEDRRPALASVPSPYDGPEQPDGPEPGEEDGGAPPPGDWGAFGGVGR